MAVTQLNSTTLTNAIGKSDTDFAVGATTNIAVGNLLIFAGTGGTEAMKVQEIPSSGRVRVMRGVNGTRTRSAPAATLIYSGAPEVFKEIQYNAQAILGDSGNLPDYVLPGTRGEDGAGNQYVLVDLTFTAFNGVAVLISKDGLFSASALVSGNFGSVGILCEEGTSNQYAWAQIYGFKTYVQFTSGSSLMTSTGIVQPATSATVPVGALLGRTTSQASSEAGARIFGIYPSSAITTATTAATSATGFQASVWMQYPFLERAMSS